MKIMLILYYTIAGVPGQYDMPMPPYVHTTNDCYSYALGVVKFYQQTQADWKFVKAKCLRET